MIHDVEVKHSRLAEVPHILLFNPNEAQRV